MKFIPTMFNGAWLIEPERLRDDRGFFARTWCSREFVNHGLNASLVQCNISFNHRQGTVRGMHFQRAPYDECKLVRCTQGMIYDVIVDLREESPTYCHWQGFELSAENHLSLYIPEGFAHGFQTQADATEVFYQMSREYHGPSSSGVRWDDRSIQVCWPLPISVISEKDCTWPEWTIRRKEL